MFVADDFCLIATSIPRILPSLTVQSRWFAEPLRLLSFPSTTFLANQSGYPVLSKAHQSLVFRYMRLRFSPWILLTDVGSILTEDDSAVPTHGLAESADTSSSPTPAEAAAQQAHGNAKKALKDSTPHLSYVRYLQRNQPPRTVMEQFGSGYQDYLQAPLQPLTDNLESVTYEVFEKDPVKYDWYERAIAGALNAWTENRTPGSGPDEQVVLAIVGAGRGPLVSRTLRAAAAANINIEVWAIEKNPNAYVLLQRHNQDHWDGQVNVVWSDMRTWKGPRRLSVNGVAQNRTLADSMYPAPGRNLDFIIDPVGGGTGVYGKIDILVSELLGSFGDNELSPECLDGAQHLLNPINGLSIPSAYDAYLTPIAAPRLHAEIRSRSETDPTAPETPYVVMLHAHSNLSTISASSTLEPVILKAWQFSHPSPSLLSTHYQKPADNYTLAAEGGGNVAAPDTLNQHNARFARLKFPCSSRGPVMDWQGTLRRPCGVTSN